MQIDSFVKLHSGPLSYGGGEQHHLPSFLFDCLFILFETFGMKRPIKNKRAIYRMDA